MTSRVAIIGAGASGLTALKTALQVFEREDVDIRLNIHIYEKHGEVGGVWYDDNRSKYFTSVFDSDSDCRVISTNDPSPMYDGLRTNLPHDLMSFRDHPFPPETPVFPDAKQVEEYLKSYADKFNLRQHIRFNSPVERLWKDGDRWVVRTKHGEELYDRVIVANGHYADTFVPSIPGLSTFTGAIMHSRYYRSPEPFSGQTVLVVGSFASGSDLARLIASYNTHSPSDWKQVQVYVSSDGDISYASRDGEWARFVTDYPLIDHIEGKSIFFKDGSKVMDVDTIIFATGYHYSLPFCNVSDTPWSSQPVLGDTGFNGELKGLYMSNLDPLLLFLRDDRSIAFPVLQYQIVPFPLAEAQARFIVYLWAGLIPSLNPDIRLPPNPAHTTPGNRKPRKVVQTRKEFVFGDPYEWTYEEWLMNICLEADDQRGTDDRVPDYWKRIEPWRRARREDKTLRKRTLGY